MGLGTGHKQFLKETEENNRKIAMSTTKFFFFILKREKFPITFGIMESMTNYNNAKKKKN